MSYEDLPLFREDNPKKKAVPEGAPINVGWSAATMVIFEALKEGEPPRRVAVLEHNGGRFLEMIETVVRQLGLGAPKEIGVSTPKARPGDKSRQHAEWAEKIVRSLDEARPKVDALFKAYPERPAKWSNKDLARFDGLWHEASDAVNRGLDAWTHLIFAVKDAKSQHGEGSPEVLAIEKVMDPVIPQVRVLDGLSTHLHDFMYEKMGLRRRSVNGAVYPHGARQGNPGYTPADLEEGARHELEHTDNLDEARKIARDHLDERPDYYRKLAECFKETGSRFDTLAKKARAAVAWLQQAKRAATVTDADHKRAERAVARAEKAAGPGDAQTVEELRMKLREANPAGEEYDEESIQELFHD